MTTIAARRIAVGLESFAARTPTLPPATHTQSYAIGERDVVLVEPATPYDDERREWLAWARGLASSGRNVVAIFLTHHHPDHVGGAEFFAAELSVPLWAHADTASRVSPRIGRLLTEGEAFVLEGPAPQRWEVLHTPGHAPGHLCLWEERARHVIVGDMVASVGTIVVAPDEGDMAEYIRQLRRLEALGAQLALPAHGGPIDEPSALFLRYVAHRLMREERVLAALGAAGAAGAEVDDLVPNAYADTPRAAWPLARLSLGAHLNKLVDEGRATEDGTRYYAAVEH